MNTPGEFPNKSTRPPNRRWIPALALVLALGASCVAGAVMGALSMRTRITSILSDPNGLTERVLPRIQARVGLTDEQTPPIEALILRRHMAMALVRWKSASLLLADMQALRAEVAHELRPEQAAKWKELSVRITSSFLRPAGTPPAFARIIQEFDANKDLQLAEDEVFPSMWSVLRDADASNDGLVEEAEYQSLESLGSD